MPIGIQIQGKFVSLPVGERDLLVEFWSLLVDLFKTPFFPDKKQQLISIDCILQRHKLHSNDLTSSFTLSSLGSCRFYYDEFWNCVHQDDPDTLLLRFLHARKLSLSEAFKMLVNCLVWRGSEFHVTSLMRKGEQMIKRSLLTKGQVAFRGVDLQNRLLVHIDVGLHEKAAQSTQEMNEYVIYMIEIGRTLMPAGTETFTIVFDMSRFSLSCIDMPGIQFVISCLSNYYPESLGCCLIVNAPFIFHGVYKIIKAWLDPVVVSKIRFIKAKELGEFIGEKHSWMMINSSSSSKSHQSSKDSFSYSEPIAYQLQDFEQAEKKEQELCKVRDLQVEAFLGEQIRLQQSDGFDLNEIVIARQAEIGKIREIGRQILDSCRESHHWKRIGYDPMVIA